MVHEKTGSEKKSKFENKLLQTAFVFQIPLWLHTLVLRLFCKGCVFFTSLWYQKNNAMSESPRYRSYKATYIIQSVKQTM